MTLTFKIPSVIQIIHVVIFSLLLTSTLFLTTSTVKGAEVTDVLDVEEFLSYRVDSQQQAVASLLQNTNANNSNDVSDVSVVKEADLRQTRNVRSIIETVSNQDPTVNGVGTKASTSNRANNFFRFSWVLRLLRNGYQCSTNYVPCVDGGVSMRNGQPNDVDCEGICSRYPAFESDEFVCGTCDSPVPNPTPASPLPAPVPPLSSPLPAPVPPPSSPLPAPVPPLSSPLPAPVPPLSSPLPAPVPAPSSPLPAPPSPVLKPSPTVVAPVPPSASKFEISVTLINVPSADIPLFNAARSRWSSIILDDLSDEGTSSLIPFDKRCVFPSIIDDVFICAIYAQIDGLGSGGVNVVGSAGPQTIRVSDGLPLDAYMRFDVADIDILRQQNLWGSVILHEIGHVLGIGLLWKLKGIQSDTLQCPYNGVQGNAEYEAITGCNKIPIESGGINGTRCSHFDEECMQEELMTGVLNVGSNLLSKVTVGSLQDLGYKNLNYQQADQYKTSHVNPSCICNRRLLQEESKNIQMDGMQPKGQRRRKLSTVGRQTAMDYGKNLLANARTQYEAETGIPVAESNLVDNETGIKFVGGDVVSVLIKEKGELYGVLVHWDD